MRTMLPLLLLYVFTFGCCTWCTGYIPHHFVDVLDGLLTFALSQNSFIDLGLVTFISLIFYHIVLYACQVSCVGSLRILYIMSHLGYTLGHDKLDDIQSRRF